MSGIDKCDSPYRGLQTPVTSNRLANRPMENAIRPSSTTHKEIADTRLNKHEFSWLFKKSLCAI